MELYNGTYCASYEDLAGIMTMGAIQQGIYRGKITQARRGCLGSVALVEVESLPKAVQVEVHRRFPDLQAASESKLFTDSVVLNGEAAAFYASYKIDGVRGLSKEKQTLYTNDASIMDAFKVLLSRSDSAHRKAGRAKVNRGEFWQRAASALPRICEVYEHNLPENARRLQQKYNDYLKGGKRNYEVFITQKFQNANASAIQGEDQEALLVKLISDPRNLDCEQVASLYNVVAEKMGWRLIKAGTVRTWREKYDLETAASRLGKGEFYNQRALQVSRRKPSSPMLLWSLDGWDVELYYQKSENGVTTYHNRLVLEVVVDAYNNYPIGFAIGERETAELIRAALQNAMNHTQELFGERLRVDEIQSDHYAMKAMEPIYVLCADKFVPARVGNAKSKPIERYFGTLNKTYCQLMPNWSGFGITSDKRKQPNSDFLNMMRKQFPDREGVIRQITEIIGLERKAKREAYVSGISKLRKELRRPLGVEQYLLAFGEQTGYKNALEGSGLNVRILGERRQYDTRDLNFRKYSHVRWNIRYDKDHLEQVLAVNDEGDLRFVLEQKYVQPMALADRQAGDAEQLALIGQANKQLEQHVVNTLADKHEKVEVLFRQNPQLGNVLTRALLVDSRGQHKDNRKALQLEQPRLVVTEPEERLEASPTKETSTFDLY